MTNVTTRNPNFVMTPARHLALKKGELLRAFKAIIAHTAYADRLREEVKSLDPSIGYLSLDTYLPAYHKSLSDCEDYIRHKLGVMTKEESKAKAFDKMLRQHEKSMGKVNGNVSTQETVCSTEAKNSSKKSQANCLEG